jgi:predicted deacylase
LQRFYGLRDVYFYPADKMWQPVYAHSEGILDYMYDVGAEVKKGDVIATVRGDSKDIDVVSPCNGWIAEIHDNLWVQPGDEFCHVQPII